MKFTAAITVFTLAAAAVAAPAELEARTDKIGSSVSKCSAGTTSLKCCNTSAASCSNVNQGNLSNGGLLSLLDLLPNLLSNAQLNLLQKNGCDSNTQIACCEGASLINVCSPIKLL